MDTGRKHNQLRVIGQRHARPVDALVTQPRGLELMRVEEDHGLLDLAIHHQEVALERELRGQLEGLVIVRDIQAAHDQLAAGVLVHHRLDVDDLRQLAGKVGRTHSSARGERGVSARPIMRSIP